MSYPWALNRKEVFASHTDKCLLLCARTLCNTHVEVRIIKHSLSHCLIDSIKQRRPWQADNFTHGQEILCISGTRMFITILPRACFSLFLFWARFIHSTPFSPVCLGSIWVSYIYVWVSRADVSFRFSNQNPACTSPSCFTYAAQFPLWSPRWLVVSSKVMKLLFTSLFCRAPFVIVLARGSVSVGMLKYRNEPLCSSLCTDRFYVHSHFSVNRGNDLHSVGYVCYSCVENWRTGTWCFILWDLKTQQFH